MKIQKILSILVLAIYFFGHAALPLAYAAPEAPSAPSAPSAPAAPSAPKTPKAPEPPKPGDSDDDDHDEDRGDDEDDEGDEDNDKPENTPAPSASSSPSSTPKPSQQPVQTSQSSPTPAPSGNQSGQQSQSGQNGDTNLKTGDATNQAGLVNSGNNNASSSAPSNGTGTTSTGPSLGVANSGNGAGSNNSSTASVSNGATTVQGNSASVANNLNQTTVTGQNDASKNTGGNTNLQTGDANVTGTVVNNLNTNASGIAVAEFNVEDDHVGDIVLDFAAGCISNCGPGSVNLANSGNGAESTNSANLDVNNENNTFQSNDADLENNLVLVADSGNNNASKNTGGDTTVQTGDANVSANVLTFANNNVAGNVVYTAVNIFGDLVGDIVMNEDYIKAAGGCLECGGGDVNLANSGNGAGSDNTLNVDQNTENNTFQSNDANIENNIIVDANTAGNSASANTGGDNNVTTGDTNVDANVLNVANSNVAGGVWWLVLVNEAGNWVGKIVGSPDGTNMAGSEGTEFRVDENGEVYAANSGNGADSTNTTNASINESNTTVQNNEANLVNNLDLTANTGNNTADKNTGGNTEVRTGDANVVANIVNFVNNNITGGGKLFVTTVNVIGGSWIGNFITPDATPEEIADADKEIQDVVGQGAPEEEEVVEEEEVIEEDETVEETEESDDQGAVAPAQKKTKKVAKKKGSVAAATNSDSNGGTGSGGLLVAAGASLSQVAGVKIGPSVEIPEGAVVGNEKIRINLAWLVLALPLLALVALSRIRIAYYTRALKNKLGNKKVEGVMLGSLVAACVFMLNRVS